MDYTCAFVTTGEKVLGKLQSCTVLSYKKPKQQHLWMYKDMRPWPIFMKSVYDREQDHEKEIELTPS